MALTTPKLIADSWRDLAQSFVTSFADQAKQNLEADDFGKQQKALYDGGGRIVTALLGVGVTMLEVVEYVTEPVEDRVMTQPVPTMTTTPTATPHTLVPSDFVHRDDSTKRIKAKEILVGAYPVANDLNLWFTVQTWINGREYGMYTGTVEVKRATGASEVVHTYVNV